MKGSLLNIPEDLLVLNHFSDDISILIGENGSGKSTLLNNLSQHFLSKRKNVIALANSIHDKFESNSRNFKALRGRTGRKQSRKTIKETLISVASDGELMRLKNASSALSYVGFDPYIGFRIEGIKDAYSSLLNYADIPDKDREEIVFLIEQTIRESKKSSEVTEYDSDINKIYQVEEDGRNQKRTFDTNIVWLGIESFDFEEITRSSLIQLFKWEAILRKSKIISRIEVFLRKASNIISMLDASSGELSLITSFVYISAIINDKTVILIDEPENSLHPRWQKEYVRKLSEICYLYQPKIIIATHSPLIVNGAELFIVDPKIYKAENFLFQLQKKEPLNVEEVLFRFFDVNTPQNRFLSQWIIRYLNLLANKKITFATFKNEMAKIESNSYDPKQIELFGSVVEIAAEL